MSRANKFGLKKVGGVFVLTYTLRGLGTMIKKRSEFGERRQDKDMPRVPFKDSHGATIKGCRRKIPDRRIGNIQAEWFDTKWIVDTYQ